MLVGHMQQVIRKARFVAYMEMIWSQGNYIFLILMFYSESEFNLINLCVYWRWEIFSKCQNAAFTLCHHHPEALQIYFFFCPCS